MYTQADEPGWHPVTHMVELLAELSGARVTRVPYRAEARLADKLAGMAPLRRRGAEDLLLVCPAPGHLQALTKAPGWRSGYRSVSAWIIDSWWDDRIPRVARGQGKFDRIFISEPENLDRWLQITGAEVSHLPVGSDVLGNGVDASRARPVDVLRVGRMAPAWENDDVVGAACRERGLTFEGRPPMVRGASPAMQTLWHREGRAKFVLAFSNSVSQADYTHPTAEYFTPRWADALACGATTVGQLPRSATSRSLWDGAAIDVPVDDLSTSIDYLMQLASDWTPATALRNRSGALLVLDWRHRFNVVAQTLGVSWPSLTAELNQLENEAARIQILLNTPN